MSTVEVIYEIDGGFRFLCACEFHWVPPKGWEDVRFVSVEECAYEMVTPSGKRWSEAIVCWHSRQAFYQLLNDGNHVDRIIERAESKLEHEFACGLRGR